MKRLFTFIVCVNGLFLCSQGQVDSVKAKNLGPSQDAEKFYNSGISNYTNRSYSAALDDFNQSILLKGDFDLAYYNRGNTKMELKDLKGAIEDFDKLIKLMPK